MSNVRFPVETLDTVLVNARIVDVVSLDIFTGWIGIKDGKFAYVEGGSFPIVNTGEKRFAGRFEPRQIIDVKNGYVLPGFVDSHMHIESSLLIPRRFEEAVISHGTTAILNDPHEVANVSGVAGVKWFMKEGNSLKLRVFHAIPSCVPASSPKLEWTAHVFGRTEVEELAKEKNVIALGEVMDYRRVLANDESLRAMVDTALRYGLRVEGHIPTLSGYELSRYLSWGITSDHTLMTPDRIRERITRGVYVMLQMKSITEQNIETVMSLGDRSHILIVTDDVEPSMLVKGHLSSVVRRAIGEGMPPAEAIASASLRPARYLGLRNIGIIAPGYMADFLLIDDLREIKPKEVYIGGELVAQNGGFLGESNWSESGKSPTAFLPDISRADFILDESVYGMADRKKPEGKIPFYAVGVENEENSLTSLTEVYVRVKDGYPEFVEGEDIAFVGVFARNGKSKNLGFIKGLGLRGGAYASTFQHDSHNLMILGRSIDDMLMAGRVVKEMGGGVVVVKNEQVIAGLPLPVMGILSDRNYKEVAVRLEDVENALCSLGVKHKRPFLFLSVLCLSVSPYFKFSDRGIIDTEKRELIKRELIKYE